MSGIDELLDEIGISLDGQHKDVCVGCSELFKPTRISQVYCSRACKDKNWSKINKQVLLQKYQEKKEILREKRKDKAHIAKQRAKNWYHKNKERSKEYSREWKRKNKDRRNYLNKKSYLKQTYGITLEQYLEIKIKQNNKCAICKKEKQLHIDHCHITGRVRELLCPNCNRLLGMWEENIEILDSASAYIKKWKAL